MSRRAIALGAPLVLLALSACRAIVGITDLSVDGGGADAGVDRVLPDARGTREAGVDAADSADVTDAASDSVKPSDGGSDGPRIDCDAQPPSGASLGRIGCISGCEMGHFGATSEFYAAASKCFCDLANCGKECVAYCSGQCEVDTEGACNDCATHFIVSGACHKEEDTTCAAGCGTFATCLASCPDE